MLQKEEKRLQWIGFWLISLSLYIPTLHFSFLTFSTLVGRSSAISHSAWQEMSHENRQPQTETKQSLCHGPGVSPAHSAHLCRGKPGRCSRRCRPFARFTQRTLPPCTSLPSHGPWEGFQEMRTGWTSPQNRLGKLGTYTLN